MKYGTKAAQAQGEVLNSTNESVSQTVRSRKQRRAIVRDALSRACNRVTFEGLESRQLLSTLPAPQINHAALASGDDLSNTGNGVYNNSPSIAYDPKNPQKLVMVYTQRDTNASGTQTVFARGRYSINGGQSWNTFNIPTNITNPTISQNQAIPYERATDVSVAFDSQDNFYVVMSQNTGSQDQGALVLQKYAFATNTPVRSSTLDSNPQLGSGEILYQWSGYDSAFSPTVAVDTNQAFYVDPDTNDQQVDPWAGNIYVAWSTNDKAPTNASAFNPNTIKMIAADTDASATELDFSTPITVNVNNHSGSNERDGSPRIAISQGTADGSVTPGQVTVIWDNYKNDSNISTDTDNIQSRAMKTGAEPYYVANTGGVIADMPSGQGAQPAATSFTLPVNIGNAAFTLSDLDVEMSLSHQNLSELSIVLYDPIGSTLLPNDPTLPNHSITLVRNKAGVNGRGIQGTELGQVNGYDVPVVFDQDAARTINDANANTPYTAHFRPEVGSLNDINKWIGKTAAELNGNWTVVITDNNNSSTGSVTSVALRMNSGLKMAANEVTVAQTHVLGAASTADFPKKDSAFPAAPDRGVGPGAQIASDNTLGSFSPYQGRLYVTYVDRSTASGNPSDNTDIYLKYSDNGGTTWNTIGVVNDDESGIDGFSQSAQGQRGRAQFMPSITVDQTTGTLVMMWYDARHDPSGKRVAQYFTTSIDGGDSFSKQTWLNRSIAVTDAITGKVLNRGPIPDNQSTTLTVRDTNSGFGTQQSLVAVNGRVYPVWTGNLNGGTYDSDPTRYTHIYTAPTIIGAGPRIIDSTMGPVGLNGDVLNPPAADGSPVFTKFQVEFDRPVDPASFTPSAVQVMYRSPTTLGVSPGTIVPVSSVTPDDVDQFGATTFTITLTTPQTKVGTYSYHILPLVHDRIRNVSVAITPSAPFTVNATGNQIGLPVPTSGTGGTGTASDLTTSTLTVSNIPLSQVISTMSVKLNLSHANVNDLTVKLIAPDAREVILYEETASGINFTDTVFDDNASKTILGGSAPYTGTFRPKEDLGDLTGMSPNGDWTLVVEDGGSSDVGTLNNWSITFNPGILGPALGNSMDQNANADIGEPPAAGVTNGDAYAMPTPVSTLTGSYTSVLVGQQTVNFFAPQFESDTAPIIVPGPHVIATSVPGNAASPDNLVLNKVVSSIDIKFDRPMDKTTITPASITRMVGPMGVIAGPFTITPNPLGTDPDAAFPQTYRIGFPAQALSGTYTVTLVSTIKSKGGDMLDADLNAGVDAVRVTPSAGTATVTSVSSDLPKPVGGKVVQSVLNITDAFLIQSATLQLSMTYPNDPDLSASLIAPDGTTIPLFTNVGQVGVSKANFTNTVFDDAATTPIQNGAAPFFGRFNPQSPLSVLQNKIATGKWILEVKSTGISSGSLTAWSLTFNKPVPSTGLGELAADQANASFRIFTMDSSKDQSHQTWTPVGGASNNDGAGSTRISGLAVDPSDPSGNTVYASGASAGVWKTRNFLTTDPQGPTWIPLTDFGPTFGMNIGSIAVFSQNKDPNQSVIFAGTGEGDSIGTYPNLAYKGVGFLRSFDGGANWTLLDSTTNVDAQGQPLPINSPLRDHKFVGTSTFKVLVDPKATPAGDVIVYAALSGGAAGANGVWRSLDSGKHWTRMRAGEATDLVFDNNSGFFDALNNPTGNLQYLYVGMKDEGVYFSPNRGTVWNLLAGTTGTPLIRDNTNSNTAVQVNNPNGSPNGNKGRITLAKPAPTGNPATDLQYQGWLYALVADQTVGGALDGLYLTKDFGQTWTKVRIPITSIPNLSLASNDTSLPDYNIMGTQGNFDQSMTVDPSNPSIVYIGAHTTGMVRVDTTYLHDAHAFYEDSASGDGSTQKNLNDPVSLRDWPDGGRSTFYPNAIDKPYINLIRDPKNIFLANASINVEYASAFTNNGAGASWTEFASDAVILPTGAIITTLGANQHRAISMVDPMTGRTRLIVGSDLGIFTAVDNGEGFVLDTFGTQDVATGARNGNIQGTEFIAGAIQPSLYAAVRGALFYGQAVDHAGSLQSTTDILDTGDLSWVGPTGDGNGIAVDQQGTGTVYRFNWPLENRFFNGSSLVGTTDFFVVTQPNSAPGIGVGRTFGLIQAANSGDTPDPQWPALQGSNIAVNPISKDQIIVSSQAGRIFSTGNQGLIWSEIGNPTSLDSTYAPALAFGAPDPAAPNPDATNFFLYAGTTGGHVFVTFTGGGSNGNEWIEISSGLDGTPVQQIITNPTRGSHEAYAVTSGGVFYMANSAAANPVWTKITGNLLNITHNSFGDSNLFETQAKALTAIVADWRYTIPDDLNNKNGPSHPVLYVSSENGVYRSFDKGVSWSLFPNINTDASPVDGGYLPNVRVSDLDLGVGEIDPTTGMPRVKFTDANGLHVAPDVLLASTFGRGSYAIRIAPTVVPNTLKLIGTVGGQQPLTFQGISQMTAFGNKVRVSIYNLTGGQNTYVAGWNGTDNGTGTDNATNWTTASGSFALQVPVAAFGPGTRIIGVKLTDDAGVTSTATLVFPPAAPTVPDLDPASDTGTSNTDDLTKLNSLKFNGTADPGVKVTILSDGIAVGNSIADQQGKWSVTTSALAAGQRSITATATDIASNVVSAPSAALIVTIDVVAPAAPSTPDMIDASDSGTLNNDNITNVTQPTFTGTAEKGAIVTLFDGANQVGTTTADINDGTWSITSSALSNGQHTITAKATDAAANTSVSSGALVITIDVVLPNTPGTPDLTTASDDGANTADNITSISTPTFTGTADPNVAVDLFADGNQIATGFANGAGNWQLTSSALGSGTYSITARARDVSGNQSLPSVGLTVQITTPLSTPSAPDLQAASDSGSSSTDNYTNVNTPTFTGSGAPNNTTVELLIGGNTVVGTTTSNGSGNWTVTVSPALADNTYTFTARAKSGNSTSAQSAGLQVTIDTSAPAVPGIPDLTTASDDGASTSDNITSVKTPTFSGTGPASTVIELLSDGSVVGSTTSDAGGNWTITSSTLSVNTHAMTARAKDQAGNTSNQSSSLSVQIINAGLATPSTPDLASFADSGDSSTDNLTNFTKPTFTGTGPANTTIQILSGGNVVGSATSNGAGAYSVTTTTALTPDGVKSITARATNGAIFSNVSGALNVTIDTTAPAVPSKPILIALNVNKPQFKGTGPANTKIDLIVNNTSFGSTTSDGSGNWNITTSAIPNGKFDFGARSRDAAGNVSATSPTLSLTINNSPPPPPPLTITSFTLVNTDTGKDLFDITDQVTIDLSTLPLHLGIRANPAPTNVASVRFGWDATPGQFVANYKTESLLPYALFGDANNGKTYNAGTFKPGLHTLAATPYSKTGATGTVGTTFTIKFTIQGSAQPPTPTPASITSVQVVNATNGAVVQTLTEGSTMNLASLPSSLSIRANTSPGTVGSVRFGYDATPGTFVANYHTESSGPYSLFGDSSGKTYTPVTFKKGAHTLVMTIYSGSSATGQIQGTFTLHFTVT